MAIAFLVDPRSTPCLAVTHDKTHPCLIHRWAINLIPISIALVHFSVNLDRFCAVRSTVLRCLVVLSLLRSVDAADRFNR
jgi:hypothetical protein